MIRPHDLVVWLSDVDSDDTAFAGGKAANLGEMIHAKFPVPDGFVLTLASYNLFIKHNNLDLKIKHLLATVNYERPESLESVSKHIKKIIINSEVPEEIVRAVFHYYKKLSSTFSDALVAIRSSAVGEDSKSASFAGQQETYLNVKGEAEVIEKIKWGWASLYEPRAIYYRHQKKLDKGRVGISLVVQEMIESESSGVMFTIDPVNNIKSKIVIEAIFGLGEYIVQGRKTPDHYEVDKRSLAIIEKKIVVQKTMLVRASKDNKEVKVPISKSKVQKIRDKDIVELSELAKKIEAHYYFPQDIEWAKDKKRIYIVQTRPITTMQMKPKVLEIQDTSKEPILSGEPASPGIGIGSVKIVLHPHEIGKMHLGDVLVAPQTNPDYVPAMKKAAAIVTEHGGRTSHAAIVSREFGIPAVVGVDNALRKLSNNMIVSVDGGKGLIYKGSVLTKSTFDKYSKYSEVKTSTKLYVNLAEPELAYKIAEMNVDGVGLLRAEFMIAQIGIHPRKLIKDGKEKVFVDKLASGLELFGRAFYPRPILYRTTDFKTNEYRNLIGGKEYEPEEPNPMLGYRGAYRYIHDPRVFKMEIEAIKKARSLGLTNLNIMLPYVRTIDELREVKKLLLSYGVMRNARCKIFMMVEIPSNVILLDKFIEIGLDGVSIGSNDLTMLTLGIDRDNHEVAQSFDERNDAVLWAYEHVVKTCHKYGISSGICGQAPSFYPDLVEKLVSLGITSISVSPDAANQTRHHIYRAEQKINVIKKS